VWLLPTRGGGFFDVERKGIYICWNCTAGEKVQFLTGGLARGFRWH
jgi:hypothetical protein